MENKKDNNQMYVLGVGTSAGGMDALTKLLNSFKRTTPNLCVILVQHLSPNYKSELTSILSKQCKWQVVTAEGDMKLEPNMIYVTPQNKSITISEGKIILDELPVNYTYAPSIDKFLTSLAISEKEHAIGLILSGTGHDGAEGMLAIKENGGFH